MKLVRFIKNLLRKPKKKSLDEMLSPYVGVFKPKPKDGKDK
jgi:hypothetical protein